jgi:hypothetical protein
MNALDWYLTVHELDTWLRNQIKYEDRYELQPARDSLLNIVEERGLTLRD